MRLALVLLSVALSSPSDLVWKDGPPTLPAGAKVAVLEGNPSQPGIFTMRLRVPANAKIAQHWHPRAERVTVLSGRVRVAFEKETKTFTAGGFYVNDPHVPHSLEIPEDTVLQLTCEGPWELNLVNPAPGTRHPAP
jgi:quercetin dioxygenase-like cupin family protein